MPTAVWLIPAIAGLLASDGVEFTGPNAVRAAQIVKRPTVRAATPWQTVEADADFFSWMLDHPTAAAALWNAVGLETGTVEMLPDGWRSREPEGVVLEFRKLHRSSGIRAYYCRATAPTGAIPKTATAEIVLIHDLRSIATSDGTVRSMDRLEAWVSAEGAGLRLVMKLARGAMSNAVEKALRETRQYFALAAKMASRRPDWAREAVTKRPGLLAASDAVEFECHLQRIRPILATQASVPRPTEVPLRRD
jgi:hypothetical protein